MNIKTVIISAVAGVAIIGGVCLFSPTIKYAIRGQFSKIENEVQLNNAIEILNEKNIEMQDKYIKISTGINAAKRQIAGMQRLAEQVRTKPQTELNIAKYNMYTNGVEKMNMALAKMTTLKENIKKGVISHRSQIELLKAKKTYLESLKSMNSYTKDVNIDGAFGEGISSIIEKAIAEEKTIAESLNDFSSLKSEIESL